MLSCHGNEAHGNASEVIPSLAGQLPVYVIKQLVDLAEGERDSAGMHRIAAKKSMSTPQALQRGKISRHLGSLTAIADYASRLPMAANTTVPERAPPVQQR